MDEREVLDVLGDLPDLGATSAVAVGDGWASDTFLVDGRWIFRFPRTDAVGADLRKEMRLLPELIRHVGFEIPRFEWVGEHRGRPFAGYDRIEGYPVDLMDLESSPKLAGQLGRALRELHDFPVGEARTLLDSQGSVEGWREGYEDLRSNTRDRIVPLLDTEVARALERAFDTFLGCVDFVPVLVHRDLGTEHVLVRRGELTGIIDFEDATVGDPVIDLVGFAIQLGSPWRDRIAEAYGTPLDDASLDRVRFYVVTGAVHAVLYGLDVGDRALVEDAVVNIGRRLQS